MKLNEEELKHLSVGIMELMKEQIDSAVDILGVLMGAVVGISAQLEDPKVGLDFVRELLDECEEKINIMGKNEK